MTTNAVHIERRRLRLSVPYAITGEYIDSVDIVVLCLRTGDGHHAYGAASPSKRVTEETVDSVVETLESVGRPWLCEVDLRQPLDVLREAPRGLDTHPAARAAMDIALHDLAAKQADLPLRQLLGHRSHELPTSVTIGICGVDETIRQARGHLAAGFRCLKVKVGESLEEDVLRLKCLREAIGAAPAIRVDANQGYDADGACRFLEAVADVRIELLEQPTLAADLEALRHVTEYAGDLPIMADESAASVDDALRVLERRAASALNIKLMKCGGLAPAREILAAAKRHGVPCMVGCFDESRISMAAAAHLALSDGHVRWADLDGHLDLARDVAEGGLTVAHGDVGVSEAPGLGVTLRSEANEASTQGFD